MQAGTGVPSLLFAYIRPVIIGLYAKLEKYRVFMIP